MWLEISADAIPSTSADAVTERWVSQRTRLNVVDSDGTAILFYETLKGGTRLTRNLCALEKKPYIIVDARQITEVAAAAEAIFKFVEERGIRVLNVAGPRLSGWAEGYEFALAVVGK
jgi:hypothetical protein